MVFSLFFAAFSLAENIDSSNPYVWGENIGWINFGSTEGDVTIPESGEATGYAWGENVGWISLNCSNTSSCATVDYAVTRSSNTFSGYAWGENVGWISFSCSNTSSCATVDYAVTVNPDTKQFSGYAWGENVGWISFSCSNTSSCATVDYKLVYEGTGGGVVAPGAGAPSAPTDQQPSQPTPGPTVPPVSSPQPTTLPPTPTEGPGESPTGGEPTGGSPSGSGGGIGGIPSVVARNIGTAIDRAAETLFNDVIPAITEGCGNDAAQTGACGITVATGVATAAGAAAAAAPQQAAAAFRSLPQIIGLKRRPRKWGVVYNATTKRPIPFAKVELRDQAGRVLETRFTDKDGRYGFLASPAGLGQQELGITMTVQKDGYRFPSSIVTSSPDYQVYEQVYRGGVVAIQQGTSVNYSIPVDPVSTKAVPKKGFWKSLLIGPLADRLLAAGFWAGLVLVPVNYYFRPTTANLVILVAFFGINLFRWIAIYRPYGVTLNALTGKPMPFALVTLTNPSGKRENFTVSDEFGRYILPGQRGKDYTVTAFTPANVSPQRTASQQVQGKSYIGKQAWFTFNLRV